MSEDERELTDTWGALDEVIDQTVGLFHLLHALAAQLHGEGELTAGRRGILRGLERLGPQTVPQMARARPVSRQYIQMLVNDLTAEGLVEMIDNVAHKRSRLVKLTPQGKAALDAMYQRETGFYATLSLEPPIEDLRTTADTLRSLRDSLLQAQLRQARASGL